MEPSFLIIVIISLLFGHSLGGYYSVGTPTYISRYDKYYKDQPNHVKIVLTSKNCQGSYVSRKHILTLKECVEGVNPDDISIQGGKPLKDFNIKVERIINGPEDNPLSLLLLSEEQDVPTYSLEVPTDFSDLSTPVNYPLMNAYIIAPCDVYRFGVYQGVLNKLTSFLHISDKEINQDAERHFHALYRSNLHSNNGSDIVEVENRQIEEYDYECQNDLGMPLVCHDRLLALRKDTVCQRDKQPYYLVHKYQDFIKNALEE